ncbi:hypothetical protein GN956_G13709 [Arapaima gigas]
MQTTRNCPAGVLSLPLSVGREVHFKPRSVGCRLPSGARVGREPVASDSPAPRIILCGAGDRSWEPGARTQSRMKRLVTPVQNISSATEPSGPWIITPAVDQELLCLLMQPSKDLDVEGYRSEQTRNRANCRLLNVKFLALVLKLTSSDTIKLHEIGTSRDGSTMVPDCQRGKRRDNASCCRCCCAGCGTGPDVRPFWRAEQRRKAPNNQSDPEHIYFNTFLNKQNFEL